MSDTGTEPSAGETQVITVNYWAAARSAAGCDLDVIPASSPMPLAEVLSAAIALHPGTRLADVLAVCSVLLGDRPVATEDPASVMVPPGARVEFLPPFAGG